MIIGGVQKTSFIDYPSKISCVVFASGCNFDCPYCHNPDLVHPIADSPHYDLEEILSFLKKRRAYLDGVVISGGEPTLQKHLFDFCGRVKHLEYPIKLDTNGSCPTIIQQLIGRRLVDYIAMDIKTSPERYSPVISGTIDADTIRSSIQIIIESGIKHEFRTTCVKSIVGKDDIEIIARSIQAANLFVLQKVQYHQVRVLHPEFFENNDWYYNNQMIEDFRKIANKFVKQCIIR